MSKKYYHCSIGLFLLIPLVTKLGGMLFTSINPEIAAGYPDYERNYRILDGAKHVTMWSIFVGIMGLWFLTCGFLMKSKNRSYMWSFLAIFGPFGFIVLTMIGNQAQESRDLYRKFVNNLNFYLRVVYELFLFGIVWVVAFQIMIFKRDLMIIYQSIVTGISREDIINEQNASSGMWAFSEGNEVMYLVVLLYLLWPIFLTRRATCQNYGPPPERNNAPPMLTGFRIPLKIQLETRQRGL